jgi:hypothetical protein
MIQIQGMRMVLFERLRAQGFEMLEPEQLTEAKTSQFVLTLRPLPGVDGIRALRWVLKGLLRQHGMRCVDLREEKS